MAGELIEGLPEGLRAWVESRAEETGRSPGEVLARAVTIRRLLAEYDGPLPDPSTLDAPTTGAGDPALADRLDATDDRIDAVAEEFGEKLTDVRERVVQVKREADEKADADHDHPEIRRSAEAAASVAADVERLRADVERVNAGLDNYEGVLEGLSDDIDDLDAKTTTLASVLADLRTRADDGARRARREAATELKREANRLDVGRAACGDCGGTVRLALLDAPECPHCGAEYDGVDPASGPLWFGSATLVVGSSFDSAETTEGPEEPTTPADALGGADD